jgi:hypothetical protein
MDLIQKTKLLAQLLHQKQYLPALFLACEILAAFKDVAASDPAAHAPLAAAAAPDNLDRATTALSAWCVHADAEGRKAAASAAAGLNPLVLKALWPIIQAIVSRLLADRLAA